MQSSTAETRHTLVVSVKVRTEPPFSHVAQSVVEAVPTSAIHPGINDFKHIS